MFTRRQTLAMLGALACLPHRPGRAQEPVSASLVGTWLRGDEYAVGVLAVSRSGSFQVEHQLALPTRAHGLQAQTDGSVIVAARRPGDWLLRWNPRSGHTQWHWPDDDRRLNGHVLQAGWQQPVWTTETDQQSGAGLIGVRHAETLEKTGEWSTHGLDPHAMLVLPEPLGLLPAGTLLVANGGIPTQSETGRSHRHLDRMDPSLVALDPSSGHLLGQWRLPDARLSIRHLAFDPNTRRVGIALQAEHEDESRRKASPLLAMFDGVRLQAVAGTGGHEGYGGDICARAGGGFWVSATRANCMLGVDAQGTVVQRVPLQDACALAFDGQHWWGAGAQPQSPNGSTSAGDTRLRLDNHWVPWAG